MSYAGLSVRLPSALTYAAWVRGCGPDRVVEPAGRERFAERGCRAGERLADVVGQIRVAAVPRSGEFVQAKDRQRRYQMAPLATSGPVEPFNQEHVLACSLRYLDRGDVQPGATGQVHRDSLGLYDRPDVGRG